jgi:AcrR family transcriptional regulator/DNA-binding MarR family transcriptional regulator
VRVEGIQRSRLLAAAAGVIDELGYAHTSVERITSRARVSRRTFYELYENRDGCLAALIEDVVAGVERELAAADLGGLPWRERVRGGLWVILSFFDREPVLARVCVVQALQGGPGVLERREVLLGRLAGVLGEGRGQGVGWGGECSPLIAEGLVGAAFGIVYGRLLRGERGRLTDLFGELMGMIVLPYLGSAAARRELARAAPGPPVRSVGEVGVGVRWDLLGGVPMRLTYRTVRVLGCLAQRPGVSNRVVADLAGVSDQGQISRLLARLERLGLAANTGEGHAKGVPNAWSLTPRGFEIAQRLHMGMSVDRAPDWEQSEQSSNPAGCATSP